MAEKLGEGLLTALEERPVNIHVEAKKKGTSFSSSKTSSHFGRIEHALLAASDGDTVAEKQAQVVQRFTDLGLGRGIDATRNKPWIDKPSVQIRPLVFNRLIGTEEGGSVVAYESDVSSVQTLQLSMKQSVTAPTSVPVKIGLDGESSRSVSTSRRVVGRRVLNRTISFKEEFDEVPYVRTPLADREIMPANSDDLDGKERLPEPEEHRDLTFEEKLINWILYHIIHDPDPRRKKLEQFEGKDLHSRWEELKKVMSAVDAFEKWFETFPAKGETRGGLTYNTLVHWLFELCLSFINYFSVTHYVSAIKLGAIEYSVMSEEQYLTAVSQAGTFGLDSIVSFVFKAAASVKKTNKHSQLRRVGLIKNPEGGEYYVPRGTYAEAVIGCEVKPIHNLIKHTQLRRILQLAVSKFIDRQRDSSVGPFLIVSDSLNCESVYFFVDEDTMSLQATTNKSLASHFYIINSDKGTLVQDFHIVYAGTPKKVDKALKRNVTLLSFGYDGVSSQNQKLPYYLSTPLKFRGVNPGPLYFGLHPEKEDTLFVLQSRLRTKDSPPEVIDPWIQGREGFFIQCHKRKFAVDGFLSIRTLIHGSTMEYRPVCVSSKGATPSHLMVFRLVKPKTAEDYFPTADEFTPPPLTPFRTDSTPVEPFSLGLERVPEEGEGVMGVATEGSKGIEMHELHTAI
jgi:hypothetical protein